jgi:ribose transport system substrate-binding protein
MKQRWAVGLMAFLLVVPLLLVACGSSSTTGSSSSGNKYTIALINGDNADPFFLTIWAGAKAEAAKLGVNLIEEAPTSFSYQDQIPLLNDMIARHVNGIILSPDSETALDPEMAQAVSAGIPITTVNTTEAVMNNTQYALSFIGTSNTGLSQLGGQYLAQALHGQGTIAVIGSVAGSRGDLHRATGAIDYVHKNDPKMTVLPLQFSNDSRTQADSIATDLMTGHPDLKGIFAVDSFTGQGVGTAIESLHKAGSVDEVAIDAEPQEVTLMRQGVIQALIAQRPYKMGQLGLLYDYYALTNQKSKIIRSVITSPIIVTPSNLDTPTIKTVIYSPTAP